MTDKPRKKSKGIKLPSVQHSDLSKVQPPKRPAVEAMIENLHAAGKKKPAKDL